MSGQQQQQPITTTTIIEEMCPKTLISTKKCFPGEIDCNLFCLVSVSGFTLIIFKWVKNVGAFLNSTECIRDLDKLNLVKFDNGCFVQGSGQFSSLPQLPQK